jgi:hypothetical protein
MSEYQYYEFLAIDRPLDHRRQAEVRALSTRATITATRFVNEYHWGDFRGDPRHLVERYYDIFVYYANWGTRQVMIRLPGQLLSLETAQQFCYGDNASAHHHDGQVIVTLSSDRDDEYWEPPDGSLAGELAAVRADLASGDLRVLYLAWLLSAQTELEPTTREPPVPAGLEELSGPLSSLAAFLRIDHDMLAVAAAMSRPLPDLDSASQLGEWLVALPQSEKDRWLIRFADGDPTAAAELRQRWRRERQPDRPVTGSRTAADLVQAAIELKEARRQEQARRQADRQARLAEQAAAAREKRLTKLAVDLDAGWDRVERLIATKRPGEYDRAVALLVDLRDAHNRNGQEQTFTQRYHQLRSDHHRKSSLLERLDNTTI